MYSSKDPKISTNLFSNKSTPACNRNYVGIATHEAVKTQFAPKLRAWLLGCDEAIKG